MHFHQRLQPFGQRRLAAADGAEQIHDLLALFETLRGMAEEADDTLDRLFHAIEFVEGGIHPDRAVHEDAPQPRILRRIHHLRLADRREQALGRGGVHHRVIAAGFQIFGDAHQGLAASVIVPRIRVKKARHTRPPRCLAFRPGAYLQDGDSRTALEMAEASNRRERAQDFVNSRRRACRGPPAHSHAGAAASRTRGLREPPLLKSGHRP